MFMIKTPSGRLCVDGNISIEEDSAFIRERKNLANNGIIEVTIIISSKGSLHNKPLLTFKGLPVFEKDDFKYGLEEEIKKTAKTFSLKILCYAHSDEITSKRSFSTGSKWVSCVQSSLCSE